MQAWNNKNVNCPPNILHTLTHIYITSAKPIGAFICLEAGAENSQHLVGLHLLPDNKCGEVRTELTSEALENLRRSWRRVEQRVQSAASKIADPGCTKRARMAFFTAKTAIVKEEWVVLLTMLR